MPPTAFSLQTAWWQLLLNCSYFRKVLIISSQVVIYQYMRVFQFQVGPGTFAYLRMLNIYQKSLPFTCDPVTRKQLENTKQTFHVKKRPPKSLIYKRTSSKTITRWLKISQSKQSNIRERSQSRLLSGHVCSVWLIQCGWDLCEDMSTM